jgi:dynactin complex subunit
MEGFKLVRENVRQGSLLDVRRPSSGAFNEAAQPSRHHWLTVLQMRKMGDLERVGIKSKKDVQRALCNAYHITKTQRQGRRGVWVETS